MTKEQAIYLATKSYNNGVRAGKNKLMKEVDKIREMTLQLRNDLFFGKIKNDGNELLDKFNEIIWEYTALKNEINEIA